MDPLSQGVFGAALPMSFLKESKLRLAAWVGFLSGLLADIDVLITSKKDPLLFLEYHRHFTHSLIFIPVGGAAVAVLLKKIFRSSASFRDLWAVATLGYGTHGLLDACTSYGTQLFWPFSNARIAWHNISIVDPVLTLTMLVLLVIAFKRRSRRLARAAFAFSLLYLGWGVLQHRTGEGEATRLAARRGHRIQALEVKPSFGNLLLWKSVYETEGRYYVDAFWVFPGLETRTYEGSSIEKLDVRRDFPGLPEGSVAARDIERFRWFSNGFLSLHPENRNTIIDVRYSAIPNEIRPLWGIVLDPASPDTHTPFVSFRDRSTFSKERWKLLGQMILGKDILPFSSS